MGRGSSAVAAIMTAWLLSACDFNWDPFDPRLTGGSAASGAAGGQGGTGGSGGMPGSGGSSGAPVGGSMEGGGGIGPWSVPVLIDVLSDPNAGEDDPTITDDALELYYNSTVSGSGDVYVSQRATRSDPWGMPAPVAALNSPDFDTSPTVSADGLTFWLSSVRDGQTAPNIYRSTRPNRGATWSTPIALPDLAFPSSECDFGGTTLDELYALIGINGGIYAIERASTAALWGPPDLVSELTVGGFNIAPWLSGDGLVAVYSHSQSGTYDIYQSSRAALGDAWGIPMPIVELNSGAVENDPTMSGDQRYVVFKRGPLSAGDLYESSR